MPFGRWPDRVKEFKKWSTGQVDRAKITGSATGSKGSKFHVKRRRRRRRKMED